MFKKPTTDKNVNNSSSKFSWLSISASLPAIGAAMLPAVTCPACWPAYAGLLSSFGLGFIDYSPWLIPVTLVFLVISLVALAWQCHKRKAYGPLAVGIVGALVLVIGKFTFDSEPALIAGITLIIAASVWNAWPRKVCPSA
jgi:hypothetical protein